MSDEPLRVAVIVGSTREGRFGGAVARWFVGRARRRAGFTVDEIDLAELDLPFVYPAEPDERVSSRPSTCPGASGGASPWRSCPTAASGAGCGRSSSCVSCSPNCTP